MRAVTPDMNQTEGENRMMTRKRPLLVLLATMLIVLGAVGIRAIPVSAASTQQVPFSASFSGTAILTSPTSATFSGTGHRHSLGSQHKRRIQRGHGSGQ